MNEQGEKELLEVIARLDTIERQNQQILDMLSKLTGSQVQPVYEVMPDDVASLIALARVDRAASIAEAKRRAKESMRKKKSKYIKVPD